MIKKIKDFDAQYSSLFFCISLLIIIVFLAYFSVINKNKEKECVIPNKLVNNYSNYVYDIKVTKSNEVIDLSIKRFDSKYLIEKTENGIKSMYYIYYTDILEKSSDGKYIKYRKDNIIDGIDNKFLILDYINEVSLDSSISSDNELTCYNNRKMELSMCINLDDSITLKKEDYKIVYTVKELGSVSDFNVDVDLDYEESVQNNADNLTDNVMD